MTGETLIDETLTHERTTPGTERYTGEINGRKFTLYVPKDNIEGDVPDTVNLKVTAG
jgi:hypothetical protein